MFVGVVKSLIYELIGHTRNSELIGFLKKSELELLELNGAGILNNSREEMEEAIGKASNDSQEELETLQNRVK